jgi:hypothetical protein
MATNNSLKDGYGNSPISTLTLTPWCSPLHLGAEHGHKAIVALLLSKGAHIDAPFYHVTGPDYVSHMLHSSSSRQGGWPGWVHHWARRRALHVALAAGQDSIAKLLISSGASLDFDDAGLLNCTALHVAAHSGLVSIIELLAGRPDFDVNQRDTFGNTALHYASMHVSHRRGNKGLIRKLLSLGANIESLDHQGATPLIVACANCSKDAAETLVCANANIHAEDSNHHTPLYYAVANKEWNFFRHVKYEPESAELARTLISRGARIDHPGGSLTHAEHLLDHYGSQQRSPWTKCLWEAYHQTTDSGQRSSYDTARLDLLLENATCGTTLMWESVRPVLNQPVKNIPVFLLAPLLRFAKSSLSDAELTREITTLLDAIMWVSPSRQDMWYDEMFSAVQSTCGLRESKEVLLLKAIRHRNQRLCRRLLELHPQIDLSDIQLPGFGSTILHLACDWGDRYVVEELIWCGANVNALDHLHRLPLYYAILGDKSEIAGILMGKMSMPVREGPYDTVFQLAIERDRVEILTAMVEQLGCPPITPKSDFTYIHLACQRQIARHRQWKASSALELILEHGHSRWKASSAQEVILEHGADPNGGHECPNPPLRCLLTDMWENPSPADMAATVLDPVILLIRHGAEIPDVFYDILHYSGPDVDRCAISQKLAERLGPAEVLLFLRFLFSQCSTI